MPVSRRARTVTWASPRAKGSVTRSPAGMAARAAQDQGCQTVAQARQQQQGRSGQGVVGPAAEKPQRRLQPLDRQQHHAAERKAKRQKIEPLPQGAPPPAEGQHRHQRRRGQLSGQRSQPRTQGAAPWPRRRGRPTACRAQQPSPPPRRAAYGCPRPGAADS